MKVAVIGGRDFNDYEKVKQTLSNIDITELISGGAKGADSLGEQYAKGKGIPTKIFLPDWNKHGKIAGFIRNTDIIKDADLVVAFWDQKSKGTKDSIDKAYKLNKKTLIIKYKS